MANKQNGKGQSLLKRTIDHSSDIFPCFDIHGICEQLLCWLFALHFGHILSVSIVTICVSIEAPRVKLVIDLGHPSSICWKYEAASRWKVLRQSCRQLRICRDDRGGAGQLNWQPRLYSSRVPRAARAAVCVYLVRLTCSIKTIVFRAICVPLLELCGVCHSAEGGFDLCGLVCNVECLGFHELRLEVGHCSHVDLHFAVLVDEALVFVTDEYLYSGQQVAWNLE